MVLWAQSTTKERERERERGRERAPLTSLLLAHGRTGVVASVTGDTAANQCVVQISGGTAPRHAPTSFAVVERAAVALVCVRCHLALLAGICGILRYLFIYSIISFKDFFVDEFHSE